MVDKSQPTRNDGEFLNNLISVVASEPVTSVEEVEAETEPEPQIPREVLEAEMRVQEDLHPEIKAASTELKNEASRIALEEQELEDAEAKIEHEIQDRLASLRTF